MNSITTSHLLESLGNPCSSFKAFLTVSSLWEATSRACRAPLLLISNAASLRASVRQARNNSVYDFYLKKTFLLPHTRIPLNKYQTGKCVNETSSQFLTYCNTYLFPAWCSTRGCPPPAALPSPPRAPGRLPSRASRQSSSQAPPPSAGLPSAIPPWTGERSVRVSMQTDGSFFWNFD